MNDINYSDNEIYEDSAYMPNSPGSTYQTIADSKAIITTPGSVYEQEVAAMGAGFNPVYAANPLAVYTNGSPIINYGTYPVMPCGPYNYYTASPAIPTTPNFNTPYSSFPNTPYFPFSPMIGSDGISSSYFSALSGHPYYTWPNVASYQQAYIGAHYDAGYKAAEKTRSPPYGSPESEKSEYFNRKVSPGFPTASPNKISYPRGPPKKPLQSGHALWVGNLPPGASFSDLLDLFGNSEIQSIFLIQNTNCAFVNYKSEKSVEEIIEGHSVKELFLKGNVLMIKKQESNQEATGVSTENKESQEAATDIKDKNLLLCSSDSSDRFFICKSLTNDDLEASIKQGEWSTQSRNVAKFNKAFKDADNVYLFFSVNRAGNFFGYARMESEIPTKELANLKSSTSNLSTRDDGLRSLNISIPSITVTEANELRGVPAGRIVDDSSRGTLFWEVIDSSVDSIIGDIYGDSMSNWTMPFKIKWLTRPDKPVPFFKTANLSNAFNNNKPVKIARDGTEIDPTTAKELMKYFHQLPR